jgi:hypothetical protein
MIEILAIVQQLIVVIVDYYYKKSMNVSINKTVNSYHIMPIYPPYIKRRNVDSNMVIRPSDKHCYINIIFHYVVLLLS